MISDNEELNEDWLSVYLDYKEKRKIKERSGFIKTLLKFFREKLKKLPLPSNIKLNDEKSEIIAARFVIHSNDIKAQCIY